MRRLFLFLALLLPLLVIAGCEEAPTEPTVSTTGTWTGTAQITGSPIGITLVLAESRRNITGLATVGTASANVTGRNNFPNVTLSFEQMSYEGTFAGDNMIVGTLTGPGVNGAQLHLQRQ